MLPRSPKGMSGLRQELKVLRFHDIQLSFCDILSLLHGLNRKIVFLQPSKNNNVKVDGTNLGVFDLPLTTYLRVHRYMHIIGIS